MSVAPLDPRRRQGTLAASIFCLVALALSLAADDAVRLETDTSEAEAVLAILARRATSEAVPDSDWQRLFEAGPYTRLKQREAEMKRPFEDAEFREFVLSDDLMKRRRELERTLASWKQVDLEASARSVLGYLPSQARIRSKVFPVIKPRTNSFVFDLKNDPTIFLYVDPAVTAEQFANTVRHELHHIGLASVSAEKALEGLPLRAKVAAGWMGAFGEGMAMLAAAGGPDVHPHFHSSPADKARWDRDVANFSGDLREGRAVFPGCRRRPARRGGCDPREGLHLLRSPGALVHGRLEDGGARRAYLRPRDPGRVHAGPAAIARDVQRRGRHR